MEMYLFLETKPRERNWIGRLLQPVTFLTVKAVM